MNTEIGSLITSTPEIRHGRPCIAGTGITVHRIAIMYKLGYSPELPLTKQKRIALRRNILVKNKSHEDSLVP